MTQHPLLLLLYTVIHYINMNNDLKKLEQQLEARESVLRERQEYLDNLEALVQALKAKKLELDRLEAEQNAQLTRLNTELAELGVSSAEAATPEPQEPVATQSDPAWTAFFGLPDLGAEATTDAKVSKQVPKLSRKPFSFISSLKGEAELNKTASPAPDKQIPEPWKAFTFVSPSQAEATVTPANATKLTESTRHTSLAEPPSLPSRWNRLRNRVALPLALAVGGTFIGRSLPALYLESQRIALERQRLELSQQELASYGSKLCQKATRPRPRTRREALRAVLLAPI